MNRRIKSSRRGRGSSKKPQPSSLSDHSSQPSSSRPPKLLPPSMEGSWRADQVWALISQNERSWSANQFSDTPEYWNGIAPFFTGLSAENLHSIHMALLKFEQVAPIWKQDEIQMLIASIYGNLEDPMDTPEWWGKVAANIPWRCALDCRIAFKTFGISNLQSKKTTDAQPHQQETKKPSVSSTTGDAMVSSSQRTSQELPKTMPKEEKQQQQQAMQPSVPGTTMDTVISSSRRTSQEPPKTMSKEKQRQQQQAMQPSVPSTTMDTMITSTQRTSQETPKTMLNVKQQLQPQAMQPSVPKTTMENVISSSQRISQEPPKTMLKGKQQQQAMQPSVPSSKTFSGVTSSQRTTVEPLQNWTLEDYIFLMKILTRNFHVDTDDEGVMKSIASLMVGKTGEEVRHLILKWRPQLLAALEKADRITGSSSGTKEAEMSDSSQE